MLKFCLGSYDKSLFVLLGIKTRVKSFIMSGKHGLADHFLRTTNDVVKCKTIMATGKQIIGR